MILAITLYSSLLSIGEETKAQSLGDLSKNHRTRKYPALKPGLNPGSSSKDTQKPQMFLPPIHTLHVYLWVAREVDSVLI